MSFVGNNRKFPLKDLTGNAESNAKLIREHFERVKSFVPRSEPLSSASVSYSGTLPTNTTAVTIDASSYVTVPPNAVGALLQWHAGWGTTAGFGRWRMDSGDGWKIAMGVAAGSGYSNFNGPVFFSPGTTSFDVSLSVAPTGINQAIYFNGFIY